METTDLNIDNYNLDDLLKLFNLDYNFEKKELKEAKKLVMKVHPDKSKLDKDYFIFFTKAFKTIYSIYEFRNQSQKRRPVDYIVEKDEEKELLLKDISKSKNFNKIFNELFDKHYIRNDDIDNGYGEWLKTINNDDLKVTNMRDMHVEFDKKKERLSALVVSKDIEELEDNNYTDIIGDKPDSYSSSIFSSLNYEDLRIAHTETVIPVTHNDYLNKKKFNNINDIMNHRDNQEIKPLSEKQSLEYLNNKTKNENKIATIRAYKFAKQEETNKKINDNWMQGFKKLKER
tara:strand:- start:2980 stop:3843 length:864 start_codon:yes stop_codon:yes gene_type:complete